MKLTYWYSQCPHDSDVFSIREKTKKAAQAMINAHYGGQGYPEPIKVTVEYRDAFDLMEQCSQEDHHYWEAQALLNKV